MLEPVNRIPLEISERASSLCLHLIGCGFFWGLSASLPALADLTPTTGQKSLDSRVTCNGGLCSITGGISRGGNRFHRFDQFDTTSQHGSGIDKVEIENHINTSAPGQNVFLGILSPALINKPISLVKRANLFVLSPQGLHIRTGAAFLNVNTLLLTTSASISLPKGEEFVDFNATSTEANEIHDNPGFNTPPSSSITGVITEQLREASLLSEGFFSSEGTHVDIVIEPGVSLSVERSLLIVSNRAPIRVSGAVLESASQNVTDGIAIVGQDVSIVDSRLLTNTGFTIREPIPSVDPAEGVLSSPIINSNCSRGSLSICSGQRPDSLSSIVIRDTTIADAGNPMETWLGEIRVTGWGCRNEGSSCPAIPQSPDGESFFKPLGNLSTDTAAPGRLAFRGLDISGLTIAPEGPITRLELVLAVDWGSARNLRLISPPSVTERAFRFQTASGAPIAPSPIAIDAFRKTFTPELAFDAPQIKAYANGWSRGQINDISDPANRDITYQGDWWDGGDVTFNNIRISRLSPPAADSSPPINQPAPPTASTQPPSPTVATGQASSAPISKTVKTEINAKSTQVFDQILFDIDQNVFSDSDVTSLSSDSKSPLPSESALTGTPDQAADTPSSQSEENIKRKKKSKNSLGNKDLNSH